MKTDVLTPAENAALPSPSAETRHLFPDDDALRDAKPPWTIAFRPKRGPALWWSPSHRLYSLEQALKQIGRNS